LDSAIFGLSHGKHDVSRNCKRQGASRRFDAEKPAASALPLIESGAVHFAIIAIPSEFGIECLESPDHPELRGAR